MTRKAEVKRKTKETEISLKLTLDGEGEYRGKSGVPFLDHMLSLWAKNARCDLEIEAKGDLEVDAHHTVEDIGICLGQAVALALGEKEGVNRYGSALIPMDEALVLASLDLSGRAYLAFEVKFPTARVGEFETELFKEFFQAFAREAKLTLHFRALSGENTHHLAEAVFKAWGRAFREATEIDPRLKGVPSTKGVI